MGERDKEMISRMIAASDTEAEDEDNDYHNVIHVPYIKSFAEKIARELKKLNIGWVMKRRATIKSKVQDLKPPESKLDQKDVIYKINCRDWRTSYIGETGQTLRKRLEQHRGDVERKVKTNGIFQHLKKQTEDIGS